jgi:cytochrome oxidase Cu insertion factor (SCO1/SenC/PrrC family)
MKSFLAMKKIVLTCLLAACFGSASASPFDLTDVWIDDNENPVRLDKWRGRPIIVSMEYSNCRFICSISQRKLQEIQAEADRRKLTIEFVVLSLDPKNDTPALWRQYRKQKDLVRSNWHFLTGSRKATDNAVFNLGVKWWYYDEHIMHELKIIRLAANGEIARIMSTYDMTAAQFLD